MRYYFKIIIKKLTYLIKSYKVCHTDKGMYLEEIFILKYEIYVFDRLFLDRHTIKLNTRNLFFFYSVLNMLILH